MGVQKSRSPIIALTNDLSKTKIRLRLVTSLNMSIRHLTDGSPRRVNFPRAYFAKPSGQLQASGLGIDYSQIRAWGSIAEHFRFVRVSLTPTDQLHLVFHYSLVFATGTMYTKYTS